MWFFATKGDVNKLKRELDSHALKIATLEGYVLNKSQSHISLSESHKGFEARLVNRIKHNKKSLVMAQIIKLLESRTVSESFVIIVKERGLCSKASFYRYISSLKSQNLLKLRL